MDIAAVIEHVRRQIAATPVTLDPFPHLEVAGLVPDAYYAELQRRLPAIDTFREVDAGQNFEFAPTQQHAAGTLRDAAFWLPFATEISRAIMAAALDRLAPHAESYIAHLQRRWLMRPDWSVARMRARVATNTEAQIFRRVKGYSAAPHFHCLTEAMSCLFYLPPAGNHQHLGTDLYRIVRRYRASWANLTKYSTIDRRHVQKARTTAFVPNNALIYVNTPWAVHGNTMQEIAYDRWLALITVNGPRDMLGALPQLAARTGVNPFALYLGQSQEPQPAAMAAHISR